MIYIHIFPQILVANCSILSSTSISWQTHAGSLRRHLKGTFGTSSKKVLGVKMEIYGVKWRYRSKNGDTCAR